ncbi:hypothetical protein HDU96_007171 [Phlyctochytrium bullatum]|nr:hypothetical protein HDU96_007171 [Phlyctochytrium bullatum]
MHTLYAAPVPVPISTSAITPRSSHAVIAPISIPLLQRQWNTPASPRTSSTTQSPSALLARLEAMIDAVNDSGYVPVPVSPAAASMYGSAAAAFGCVRPSNPAPDHPRNAKTVLTWNTV